MFNQYKNNRNISHVQTNMCILNIVVYHRSYTNNGSYPGSINPVRLLLLNPMRSQLVLVSLTILTDYTEERLQLTD